jgi:hypothetical protein
MGAPVGPFCSTVCFLCWPTGRILTAQSQQAPLIAATSLSSCLELQEPTHRAKGNKVGHYSPTELPRMTSETAITTSDAHLAQHAARPIVETRTELVLI